MEAQILAKVVRGETVESIHRGHFIVLDGSGKTVTQGGNPETVTFFRSACKPIQAIPFVAGGAADQLGFEEREIALACASHSGERIHTEIAARMLDKIELTERHLRCGAHMPFNEAETRKLIEAGKVPNQLHNNCSGKHAAMLALAKFMGADITSYESIDSPVQQAIIESIVQFTGIPRQQIAMGVDGCAVPNFAIPISAMARSFVNLIHPPESLGEQVQDACGRIVSAMLNHPDLIGGSERLDTILMTTAPGTLISKVGAEGLWLCAMLPDEKWESGLAIAMKIEDGEDFRARPAVAVALLKKLGVLPADSLPNLSPIPIRNRRNDEVGRVEAVLEIDGYGNGTNA